MGLTFNSSRKASRLRRSSVNGEIADTSVLDEFTLICKRSSNKTSNVCAKAISVHNRRHELPSQRGSHHLRC